MREPHVEARELHLSARMANPLDDLAVTYHDVQLATLATEVPRSGEWTYELKWDGYRILALKTGKGVRLVGKNHDDWTAELEPIAREVGRLSVHECVLDGEVCARFVAPPLVYYVFDLLSVDGEDWRERPLVERRERLAQIVAKSGRKAIMLSLAVDGNVSQVLRAARDAGVDGIVAKEKRARYVGARTKTWLVLKPSYAAKEAEVLGVTLTHPNRVLEPTGATKLALARYYESVGDWMLPHVRERPLTLLRWAGRRVAEKRGIYMRHGQTWGPSILKRVKIQEKHKVGEYLVADSVEALISLAQMDVLEIHTWNSIASDVERPNRIVFDLDPAPDVSWRAVVDAAKDIRARLHALGLESFVKTTGGKGLHVAVPLVPDADWDECLDFTRSFARGLERDEPATYVSRMAKTARHGRIFVDYLRNSRASTSIAAYSTRAESGAPVSVPIAWDELDTLDPAALTMTTVPLRLRSLASDPWTAYWKTKQRLPGG